MTVTIRSQEGVVFDNVSNYPNQSITVHSQRLTGQQSDFEYAKTQNILNLYKTFNYLFTLAACTNQGLENPESLRSSSEYLVIARSQGKTSDSLRNLAPYNPGAMADDIESRKPIGNPLSGQLIQGFLEKSPGRFDMFIDNVEIETVMGFSKDTNLTIATKINFDIFEPYSMNGFLEALQVTAAAAGHKQYLGAPYLLKVQFAGYRDDDKIYWTGKEGTRIFVINITGIEIEVNEQGTKYRCQAVSYNDMGFSDTLALKTNFQMSGATVKEVLESLFQGLNTNNTESSEKDVKQELMDKFKVSFPKREGSTLNFSSDNKIAESKIQSVREDKNAYTFPDHSIAEGNAAVQRNTSAPGQEQRFAPNPAGRNKFAYNDNKNLIQFPAGAKIHDIICAVIRDSEYGKEVFKQLENSAPEMIEYAHVAVRIKSTGEFNSRELRQPLEYEFVIIPYEMHYTRVALYQNLKFDPSQLERRFVRRKYNYLFTGQNIDIRSFNLKFNRLYFQAYPQGFQKQFEQDPGTNAKGSPADKPEDVLSDLTAPIRADPSFHNVVQYGGNAQIREYDAYDKMVKIMHDAVLDNTDMVTCELEILGDPYYLVTQGSGNYFPDLADKGLTTNAEASFIDHDVFVSLKFRNPEDIDKNTGYMKFTDQKVPFSGVFRVTKAMSYFSSGLFTQRLFLVRVPGQSDKPSGSTQKQGIEWTDIQ